jgi:hypothetical protein
MRIRSTIKSACRRLTASRKSQVATGAIALAAVAAVAAVTLGAWTPATAALPSPARLLGTETFGYVGNTQQEVTVPAGADAATLRVIGGKGGGNTQTSRFVTGGDGAQVTGQIPVRQGEVLTLEVAGKGSDAGSLAGAGGWGGTGNGGNGAEGTYCDGGGGGGATTVRIGTTLVVAAGGGGGAGGEGWLPYVDAGGPGGSSGTTADAGHNGTGGGAGKGGGGAANGVSAGGGGGGGHAGGGGGGGGGAGAVGGGGGAGGGIGAGGGGGGGGASSYYSSLLQGPSVIRGTTPNGDGEVVIDWTYLPRPSMELSASATQIVEGQPAPVFTLKMPTDATGEIGFYNLSLPGPDKGIGVAPIIDGTATLRTPTRALLLGQNDIQASYGGNDSYAAHDSNTVTVTVSSP